MVRKRELHTNFAFNVYKKSKICEKCNSTEKICVHHIDENHFNNFEENLMILCRSCHCIIHHKGKQYSQEHRNKISLNNKGRKLSQETRDKISQSKKGKTSPMKGKKLSQEHKDKIRLVQMGNKNMLGKKHTQETKDKISKNHFRNTKILG